LARLKATEPAGHAAPKGVQEKGGYRYATEYDMERHFRAAVISPLSTGTYYLLRRSCTQGRSEQADVGERLIRMFFACGSK
jgi:alkylation response protein AidB-like acyl-CoA dehydrogenase